MKRIGVLLALVLCSLLFTALPVHGDYTTAEGLSDLLADAGAELPADLTDPEALTSVTFADVLERLMSQLRESLTEPLRLFLLLLGVILMTALAGALHDGNDGIGTVYETVCVLCAVGILAGPVAEVFLTASAILEHTADFTASFSVLYAGVLAAGGGVTSAAVYQGAMAGVCQLGMEAAARVLLPMLGMCMAVSIVDAVNPAISLSGLLSCVQKAAAWLLGLLMAVFLGLLSVQSMVAVSADRAGTKAAKYMISGCVPIIGGAVSDAYAAVLGSMGVLRSGVGFVGIAAMVSLLGPVLLRLGLYRLLMGCAAAAAELFGCGALVRLLKDLEAVLATGFSAAVSFSVMYVFSTAVMMLVSGGLSG